jgi:hypothetical protein
MRTFPLVLASLLSATFGNLAAEQLPEMRPALLGDGPRSLVNLINTEYLIKKGQPDAMVMFSCAVGTTGRGGDMVAYRGTPNSDPLAEAAIDACPKAIFIPAVYHHQNVNTLLAGTIIFRTVNGKPHLRIYLNQESEHLLRGDDFIAPQWIAVPGEKFKGFGPPPNPYGLAATVVVRITADATGKLLDSKLVFETPPGKGFGATVMNKMGEITFLPGYLHGQPVACSANWHLLYHRRDIARWKSN